MVLVSLLMERWDDECRCEGGSFMLDVAVVVAAIDVAAAVVVVEADMEVVATVAVVDVTVASSAVSRCWEGWADACSVWDDDADDRSLETSNKATASQSRHVEYPTAIMDSSALILLLSAVTLVQDKVCSFSLSPIAGGSVA